MTIAAKNFLGSITEEEWFTRDEKNSYRPLKYEYQMNILGKKRQESLVVDRQNGLATAQRKKNTYQIANALEYFGPLSYQHQLQKDLINNKNDLSYNVIYRGHLKEYIYQRTGQESLDTPLGKLEALKLTRKREDSERQTFLWVAPSLNYLPVKLYQKEEDGETYEMTIINFSVIKQ